MDAVLVYIVDTYRSLLLCFIELLVHGSLALVMGAVDLLNQAIGVAGEAVKAVVQGSVSAINATVEGTLDTANGLLKLVGQHIDVPQLAMPDLSALDHVSLPQDFLQGLQSLNASLPTLDGIRQQMDTVISEPFTKLKSDVNDSESRAYSALVIFPLTCSSLP